MSAGVSIIIPALNEASLIAGTVTAAQSLGPEEVLVVDGGSIDATTAEARRAGAGVISAAPGRARQMNAGAAAARGSIFLFLHADSWIEPGGIQAIERATQDPRVIGGTFRITFGGDDWVAATFDSIYRARLPFGIFYGDSGIWVRRETWDRWGPYRDFPIMEDYEYARRLWRAGRLAHLDHRIHVSPRRWAQGGLLEALTVWVLIQGGYSLGVPPRHLAWMYRQVR